MSDLPPVADDPVWCWRYGMRHVWRKEPLLAAYYEVCRFCGDRRP